MTVGPLEDIWQCLDTVWIATIGRQVFCWQLVGEARGAADHLTGHRSGPPQHYPVTVSMVPRGEPGSLSPVCEDHMRTVQRCPYAGT